MRGQGGDIQREGVSRGQVWCPGGVLALQDTAAKGV